MPKSTRMTLNGHPGFADQIRLITQTGYGVRSCHFGKCRQRPFNHLVGCRQADSEIVRGVHHAARQDEDVAIGERVPLPLRIALAAICPRDRTSLRLQHVHSRRLRVPPSADRAAARERCESIERLSRSGTAYCMTALGKHQPSAIWAENMTLAQRLCDPQLASAATARDSQAAGRARAALCHSCRRSASTDRAPPDW